MISQLRRIKVWARFLVALLVLWLMGFAGFVDHVRAMDAAVLDADPAVVDAIVVPTGGSERIGKGVELLREGKGLKLFISGVHRGANREQILAQVPLDKELRDCCVVLGHAAETTLGNAEETRMWMAQQGYTSLRLVTANYHTPRTLLLFRAAMPDVKIIPHPVTPDAVLLDDWWNHEGTIRLLVTEYTKLLGAWVAVKGQFL